MSLKRSRKQMTMSKSTTANANTKMKTKGSTADSKKKKVVRFKEEAAMSVPPSSACSSPLQHEDLWYTQSELTAQLEESKNPVAEWVANGYGVLVANSYLNPHVSVQEYLNALSACDPFASSAAAAAAWNDVEVQEEDHDSIDAGNNDGCMRGLESNLDADLKEERSRTRKQHVLAVLAAQHSGADANGIYVTSRQSSASSKLFAMRMGRADARWESTTNAEAAQEIVQESLLQKQQQRSRSSSISSSSSYDSLQSLLCMEPRCTSSTFTTGTRVSATRLVTLPVQEIVFGKFPQSLAA